MAKPRPNPAALRVGLLTYLLLLLGPVAGKLWGHWPVSWWLATVFGWGPLTFSFTFALLSLGWALLRPRRPY